MHLRPVARVAGKVMALAQALDLATLLARGMMKAMRGQARWEELHHSPAALLAELESLVDCLDLAEPKRWDKRKDL